MRSEFLGHRGRIIETIQIPLDTATAFRERMIAFDLHLPALFAGLPLAIPTQ
jgi:hypothetical protein